MGERPIRVVLVDDSSTVRAVLRRLFRQTGDIEVVGEAGDGAQGVEVVLALRPDVVLMDIEMPVLDGFAATEKIMAVHPTPILVLTSRANRDQMRTAFEALRRGAVDVLGKPEDTAGWQILSQTLPAAVRALATPQPLPLRLVPPAPAASPRLRLIRFVAIGASTGGPGAVRELLAGLPADLPAAVLIVQHIASGFEEGLTDWLTHELGRDVQIARDGEPTRAGAIRVAPCGGHLLLEPTGHLRVDTASPPRGGHRPSVDELFSSCARAFPLETAAVLLTGMGSDGAQGMVALRRAGALTLVQDEATSAVFGMPRAALALGAADLALPPEGIARALAAYWQGGVR